MSNATSILTTSHQGYGEDAYTSHDVYIEIAVESRAALNSLHYDGKECLYAYYVGFIPHNGSKHALAAFTSSPTYYYFVPHLI